MKLRLRCGLAGWYWSDASYDYLMHSASDKDFYAAILFQSRLCCLNVEK